jgi:hypothetical protein
VADLVPEIVDAVELTRDGETLILRGYVNGRRCPSRVKASVAAAVRDNRMPDGSFDYGCHLAQLRCLLGEVVIGLEDGEADMLAGDDGEAGGLAILRMLGWWGGADDDDEADAEGEANGENSTSATSSPNSARSTTSARKNS